MPHDVHRGFDMLEAFAVDAEAFFGVFDFDEADSILVRRMVWV